MDDPKLVHIVDDEEEVCRSTAFLMKIFGLKHRCWSSGEVFFSSSEIMAPGCAILDLRTPEPDGMEVRQQLAQRHSPCR